MANKFGRNYKLIVQTFDGSTLTIEPPFTVEFDVNRKNFSQCNIAAFRVYNLSDNNRTKLQKNQTDIGLQRSIAFFAGYGEELSLIFSGTLTVCSSVREGTNFITTMEAQDGGYAFGNAQINKQFPANTPYRSVVLDMIRTLRNYGLSPGAIGNIVGSTKRGSSFSGSTIEILKQLTNGAVYVDNGKVNILSDSEARGGEIMVIDPSSGLLGTPKREASNLSFDILFEPKLQVGSIVRLRSTTMSNFDGDYRVNSLHHKGTISDVVGGQAITTVGCTFGRAFQKVIEEIV